MVCSDPGGESGSNSLDWLRSGKEISADGNHDPASSTSDRAHASGSVRPDSDSAQSVQERICVETASVNGSGQSTTATTNVLNELFCMGHPVQILKLPRMKCPRKQTNPRHYVNSSFRNNDEENCGDIFRKDENVPAPNLLHDGMVGTREENLDSGLVEEKENEEGDNELADYSKCELTVIDTSCPVWKFEKLVFRKNDVWKVRNRKGKPHIFYKKKRKGTIGYDKSGGGKKKAKLSDSEFELKKETRDKDLLKPSYEGKNGQYTKEIVWKGISKDVRQVPEVSKCS